MRDVFSLEARRRIILSVAMAANAFQEEKAGLFVWREVESLLEDLEEKEANAYINNENVNINSFNDDSGTQRREEKSKVNRKKSIKGDGDGST